MDAGKHRRINTFKDGSNPAEDGLNRLEIVCTKNRTQSSNSRMFATNSMAY